MKVSAIMPTYNQADFLIEAVKSVIYQVDQLVVVDDGSTDRTPSLLMGAIRHEENRGCAAAINTGFEATNHELVTWVSSDNVYEHRWRWILQSQFREDVGVVYSGYWHGSKDNPLFTPYDEHGLISNQDCYIGPSFLMRRSVWEAAGPHRDATNHDYDHWLRVEEVCWDKKLRIIGIPKPLCFYRVHDQRMTERLPYDADKWQTEALERRGVC